MVWIYKNAVMDWAYTKKGLSYHFFIITQNLLFYVKHLQNNGNFEGTRIFVKRKFYRFDKSDSGSAYYTCKLL